MYSVLLFNGFRGRALRGVFFDTIKKANLGFLAENELSGTVLHQPD